MYILEQKGLEDFIPKEKPKCAKILGAEFLEEQLNLLLFHEV